MDKFKEMGTVLATANDWDVPQYCNRPRWAKRFLRRYCRRRLKLFDRKDVRNENF